MLTNTFFLFADISKVVQYAVYTEGCPNLKNAILNHLNNFDKPQNGL